MASTVNVQDFAVRPRTYNNAAPDRAYARTLGIGTNLLPTCSLVT